MTREQALEVAKKCRIDMNAELFKVWGMRFGTLQAQREMISAVEKKFGHQHGWYHVGEFAFNDEDLVGGPIHTYDA